MTPQEIEAGNRIIAVFMDCTLIDYPKTEHYIGESWYAGDFLAPFDDRTPPKVRTENLKFHSDWNWLMPAYAKAYTELHSIYEKIKSSRRTKWVDKQADLKWILDVEAVIKCHLWGLRIENAFEGVVAAIKFIHKYNAEK